MAVVGIVLTGCGDDDPSASGDSSTTLEEAGTTRPPRSKDTESPAPTDNSAYPTAITDVVMANPAFGSMGKDITERLAAGGVPGASLLVLQDGKLVEQEAYGSYDLSTVVPIASASKWLSGAVIMSVVDDGLVKLDEPISTYLPAARNRPAGAITMRQLVAFTSGLEYDERIPCYADLSVTLEECNATIVDLPLLAKPGAGYRYTGTHLHVAAGVVEAVTGKTWEEVFQERIARPLAMTGTTFTSPARNATAVDGHPGPGGTAFSTLGDYGRFLEMLVHDGVAPDGTRILESATVAEMARDQTGDAKFISAASYRKKAQTPYGVAHWLDIVDANGTALVESSPGKMGFRPWIDHVNKIAGVYLIRDTDDSHIDDSPDRPTGTSVVHTSGNFILTETARALGGKVPGPKGAKK